MKKLHVLFIVAVMILIMGILSQTILAVEQTIDLDIQKDGVRPFSDDNYDGEINDYYKIIEKYSLETRRYSY